VNTCFQNCIIQNKIDTRNRLILFCGVEKCQSGAKIHSLGNRRKYDYRLVYLFGYRFRIAPPLIISYDELDLVVKIIKKVLNKGKF